MYVQINTMRNTMYANYFGKYLGNFKSENYSFSN